MTTENSQTHIDCQEKETKEEGPSSETGPGTYTNLRPFSNCFTVVPV